MGDDEYRGVDTDEGTRFGYQPKEPKRIQEGYKPKTDPIPANPPGGKKGDSGKTDAKKR